MPCTHTFAKLSVSKATYDEIRQKLANAGYDHAFIHEGTDEIIDMHGIGLHQERLHNESSDDTQ